MRIGPVSSSSQCALDHGQAAGSATIIANHGGAVEFFAPDVAVAEARRRPNILSESYTGRRARQFLVRKADS
jgi:hypothetical protein